MLLARSSVAAVSLPSALASLTTYLQEISPAHHSPAHHLGLLSRGYPSMESLIHRFAVYSPARVTAAPTQARDWLLVHCVSQDREETLTYMMNEQMSEFKYSIEVHHGAILVVDR